MPEDRVDLLSRNRRVHVVECLPEGNLFVDPLPAEAVLAEAEVLGHHGVAHAEGGRRECVQHPRVDLGVVALPELPAAPEMDTVTERCLVKTDCHPFCYSMFIPFSSMYLAPRRGGSHSL